MFELHLFVFSIGTHTVKVKLHQNLTSSFQVIGDFLSRSKIKVKRSNVTKL